MAAISFESRQLARDLYIAGTSPATIAAKLGVKRHTVQTWRQRGKWMAARSTLSATKSHSETLKRQTVQVQDDSVQGFIVKPEVSAESARLRSALGDQLAKIVDALSLIDIKAKAWPLERRASLVSSIVASAKVVHGWDQESAGGMVNLGSMKSAREAIARQRGELVTEISCTPVAQAQQQIEQSPATIGHDDVLSTVVQTVDEAK